MGYEISFLGLVISLVFIWITGYYPGGIIVPSYLVLFVDQPERIGATWLAAWITLVCYRLVSRYLILFGKRRFVFMILIGGIWAFLWLQIFPYFFPVSQEFRVIGWVVPGLMANQFEKQGVAITTASMVTVIVMAYFIHRLIVLFF